MKLGEEEPHVIQVGKTEQVTSPQGSSPSCLISELSTHLHITIPGKQACPGPQPACLQGNGTELQEKWGLPTGSSLEDHRENGAHIASGVTSPEPGLPNTAHVPPPQPRNSLGVGDKVTWAQVSKVQGKVMQLPMPPHTCPVESWPQNGNRKQQAEGSAAQDRLGLEALLFFRGTRRGVECSCHPQG